MVITSNMKAMGTKIKIYHLNMIRPYLSDIINDFKAFKNVRVHSGNEVSD